VHALHNNTPKRLWIFAIERETCNLLSFVPTNKQVLSQKPLFGKTTEIEGGGGKYPATHAEEGAGKVEFFGGKHGKKPHKTVAP